MAFGDLRLALMTFAQRWDGTTLWASALLLPSGDPTQPLFPATPAFAGRLPQLRGGIIGSLDALPALDAGTTIALARDAQGHPLDPPVHAAELFALLKTQYAPQPPVPSGTAATDRVRKALPATYTALLPPGAQLAANVASTDDFGCTMRGQRPTPIPLKQRATNWGELIAHALRNPFLADALGLRYTFAVTGNDAQAFAGGGWLYVTLDAGDPWFGPWDATLPDAVKCYAARIPPLAHPQPRQIFTAVLFPVANPKGTPQTPNEAEIDAAIEEAEIYDDGFAELVHARQPDSLDAHVGDGKTTTNAASDAGIQIGWDDEQVLTWHNRQIAISAAQQSGTEPTLEAPLGVLGYRVDVRVPVPGEPPSKRNVGWETLMQASGTVPPALQGKIREFSGELVIEPTPSSPADLRDFWLPLYFAQWRGQPLGTRDDTPHLLAGGTAAGAPDATNLPPSRFTGSAPTIPLRYGTTYEFRVRLADLSGGGPRVDDDPIDEAVAERASVTFSRWVPPKGVRIAQQFDAPHVAPHVDRLVVTRPLIAYPEALFTWRYGTDPAIASATRDALLAQLGMQPDGTPPPPPGPPPYNTIVATGVPDPEVVQLEIAVDVRALAHDTAPYQRVYVTTRDVPPLDPIPVDPQTGVAMQDVVRDVPIPPLEIAYVDVDDVATLVAPANGPLPIPRSRDVRIAITPIAAGLAGSSSYFGTFADSSRVPVTRGVTSYVAVRAPALAEPDPLFAPLVGGRPSLAALFFRPHTDGDPVAALMSDIASALELDADGLMLRARPGERVVFGTTGFKATIAPDGGSITFASAAEIFRHWMIALQWELARDWTWDGLSGDAAGVELVPSAGNATVIGTVAVPGIASAQALSGTPDRARTRLVFLHAIDPSVVDPRDGFTPRDPYRFAATIPSETAAPLTQTSDPIAVRLPVATSPGGFPKLASAGYALSAYVPADDYASTAPRHRQLWLEITEPPATGDRLFARVLAYAPDPLLYDDPSIRATPPAEPPALGLDPEYIRTITSGQPRDDDGLEAMIELKASADNPLAYLIPLPDGVAEGDPRLFGMWTYELRFGHKDPWSLANARFSRPLVVAGVQHPAPDLPCVAIWQRLSPIIIDPLHRGPAAIGIRQRWEVVATAPYATPVLADGTRVGHGAPLTTIGFLLYAQALQADGSGYRNVLLAHQGATPIEPRQTRGGVVYDYGSARFTRESIREALDALGLPENAPLSVIAVEFYAPGGEVATLGGYVEQPAAFDPFDQANFAQRRIVRTSPLTKVEPYC